MYQPLISDSIKKKKPSALSERMMDDPRLLLRPDQMAMIAKGASGFLPTAVAPHSAVGTG